jgi:hypothetical protein
MASDDLPRDPQRSPFTPGFGNLPRVFAGRKDEFADLETMVARLAHGIYEQARLVTGDRGMGKTALLREFEQEQLELGRWVVRASAARGAAGGGAGGRPAARAAPAGADVTAQPLRPDGRRRCRRRPRTRRRTPRRLRSRAPW